MLVEDMNPIDFGFTRFEVKVTKVTCNECKIWFPLIILRTVYHRAFIFHMLIGLCGDMTLLTLSLLGQRSSLEGSLL